MGNQIKVGSRVTRLNGRKMQDEFIQKRVG